jgi:hypothetical protein
MIRFPAYPGRPIERYRKYRPALAATRGSCLKNSKILSAWNQRRYIGMRETPATMNILWVHKPTRVGSDDVHAAGSSVSKAEAIPWRIEKAVTLAVIPASELAARSTVPRCPMLMTEAKMREYSATWVKNTGPAVLTNTFSSACRKRGQQRI